MQTEHFRLWLKANKTYPENTISSRIADCRRVEKYYGDLDKILADSGEAWLIEELSYTAQNERDNVVPKIEINGNIRNSYATIKKAVRLYFEMYEL
ncbi:MAG: hypothetical protein WCJ61_11630 [Paludibacter sp.]